jgi:hypothetical protein
MLLTLTAHCCYALCKATLQSWQLAQPSPTTQKCTTASLGSWLKTGKSKSTKSSITKLHERNLIGLGLQNDGRDASFAHPFSGLF